MILPTSSAKAAELRKFVYWAVTQGQKFGPPLFFRPASDPGQGVRLPRAREGQGREPETVTSVGYDPAAPGAELERRGIRLGRRPLPGHRGRRLRGGDRPPRPDRLPGHLRRLAGDPAVRASFIWTEAWDPVKDVYGALTFVYGTVVTSVIALLLATPLSIAIALFLTEIAPRRARGADRDAGRAARGDPERRPRALGHPRLRPVGRTRSSRSSRASSAGARSSRASRRRRGCSRRRSC